MRAICPASRARALRGADHLRRNGWACRELYLRFQSLGLLAKLADTT